MSNSYSCFYELFDIILIRKILRHSIYAFMHSLTDHCFKKTLTKVQSGQDSSESFFI